MKESDRPECPKCGNTMFPGSRTPTGKVRWRCSGTGKATTNGYCYMTTNPGSPTKKRSGDRVREGKGGKLRFSRVLGGSKVYIITAAQNATPVHPVFWRCALQAAKHRKAELLVAPLRYKNPTSRWTTSQANDEIWAPETVPYLWNVEKSLNPNLILIGDVKVQATDPDPLSGFEAQTGEASAIIGHTKVALKSVASPSSKMAKIITSTGACTVKNYTDSKRGRAGKFHHTLAFLVVEIHGKTFHLRHCYFDEKTQSVTDLDTRYYEDRVVKAPRPLALITGDTHVDFICPKVDKATYGKGGIVDTLKPLHLVYHDLLDAYAVNGHHQGNPFNALAKWMSGKDSIVEEVKRACYFVRDRTPKDCTAVVVPSNHDDMLRRWILTHDWKSQPVNAEFYLQLALEMVRKTKMTPSGTSYPSPFPMVFPQIVDTSNVKLLHGDESFVLAGIQLGMHGDRGPNGSRGSIRNLRRIGVRSVIGHSHSPGISEGCFQAGTSTLLRLEYNGGPSSWLNAHVLLNADGKRQMIIIVDGKWRHGN